jgi:hypothetical protein
MAERAPLLSLDTLTERPSVVIDGTAYALSLPDTLSAVDYHRYSKLTPRFERLWGQDELSDEEAAELERILATICRIVLDAPAEVLERLTDLQRLSVCQAFIALPSTPLLQSAGQRPSQRGETRRVNGHVRPNKPTGARSRPA